MAFSQNGQGYLLRNVADLVAARSIATLITFSNVTRAVSRRAI